MATIRGGGGTQHHRHLDDRRARHLHSAGAVRHGAVVTFSAGRRHVRVEQGRLRRLRRLPHRMDLLDQQPAIFPGAALLRSQQRAVSRRLAMEGAANQSRIFHRVLRRRTFARPADEHRGAECGQMAEQRRRHRNIYSHPADPGLRRHCLVEVWPSHPLFRAVVHANADLVE